MRAKPMSESLPSFRRASILGTGLIGGSFGLALQNALPGIRIAGWDKEGVVRQAQARGAIHEAFSGDLAAALAGADLVYISLPIIVTLDVLPEIARRAVLPERRRFLGGTPDGGQGIIRNRPCRRGIVL